MPAPPQPPRARPPALPASRRKRAFISHSSKNKALADAVVAELEANGIACWISSRDIRPGEPNYGKAILDGLSACQAVVLLLTEASNRSQHVMKEAERAVNRNIPILVAKFQPVTVSRDLEYYVSSAQFLDATAPPVQQHLRTIRQRLRDLLTDDVTVRVVPRQPRRRPRWTPRLVAAGVAALAAWWFVVPPLRPMLAKVSTMVAGMGDSPAAPATSTSDRPGDAERPLPAPADAPGGTSSLVQGVEEKARFNGTLATFAKSRLANFHREALLVAKSGTLESGKVTNSDAEVLASCRIQPNMKGYTSLATELIKLLDKVALQKGTLTSDGLKTSERHGHDARPMLQELSRESLGNWNGLLAIFASDAHQTLVSQQARAGQCRLASFPTMFLIYDERITGDYGSGINNLEYNSWNSLLRQQDTGIVILLESAKNSFRHTTWRWFHLSPSDWAAIAVHAPWQFKCVLTLTDSSGSAVESDYYPLQQYGVGRVDNDRVLSLAPFFVNDDFEHYVPEITLTKSVIVLRDDVPRVKDFTATIEEIHGRQR